MERRIGSAYSCDGHSHLSSPPRFHNPFGSEKARHEPGTPLGAAPRPSAHQRSAPQLGRAAARTLRPVSARSLRSQQLPRLHTESGRLSPQLCKPDTLAETPDESSSARMTAAHARVRVPAAAVSAAADGESAAAQEQGDQFNGFRLAPARARAHASHAASCSATRLRSSAAAPQTGTRPSTAASAYAQQHLHSTALLRAASACNFGRAQPPPATQKSHDEFAERLRAMDSELGSPSRRTSVRIDGFFSNVAAVDKSARTAALLESLLQQARGPLSHPSPPFFSHSRAHACALATSREDRCAHVVAPMLEEWRGGLNRARARCFARQALGDDFNADVAQQALAPASAAKPSRAKDDEQKRADQKRRESTSSVQRAQGNEPSSGVCHQSGRQVTKAQRAAQRHLDRKQVLELYDLYLLNERQNQRRRQQLTLASGEYFHKKVEKDSSSRVGAFLESTEGFTSVLQAYFPLASKAQIASMLQVIKPLQQAVERQRWEDHFRSGARRADIIRHFGTITNGEFSVSLSKFLDAVAGAGLGVRQIKALFVEFDADGNGMLDMEEFTTLISKNKTIRSHFDKIISDAATRSLMTWSRR